MIKRPALKKHGSDENRVALKQTHQVQQRFVLKIDGQAKQSFDDKESALKAGREIKKKYPIVKVVVCDSQEGNNEIF